MQSTSSLLPKLTLVCACSLVFHAVPAAAAARSTRPTDPEDDASARARTLFRSALAHYKAGAYALALQELLSAQELTPRKSIQLNIARTHQALGDAESARQAYIALIRDYGDGLLSGQELTSQEREEAEQEITKGGRKLGESAEYESALTALSAAKDSVKGQSAKSIAILLGRAYEAREDDVAAFHAYGKLLERDLELSDARLRLTEKERTEVAMALERVRRRTATVKGNVRPAGVLIRAIDPRLGSGYRDTIDPEKIEQGLRQKIGKHTLEFSKAGYVTEARVIELLPDGTLRLDVTLKPKPVEAPVALPEPQVTSPPSPVPATPPPSLSLSPPPPPPPEPAHLDTVPRIEKAPPPRDSDDTTTSFSIGGGLWLPLATSRTLSYADRRPASMSEGAASPFRLSFNGKSLGLVLGTSIWGSGSRFAMGMNLMVQYRRLATDFETVGGTRLGGITFDELLGCLCLGGGYARSGIQFFLGPLLGGAFSHFSSDANAPNGFAFDRAHYLTLGGHVELRWVFFDHVYVAGGVQYAFSFSSIAVRDSDGEYTLHYPVTGMQGGWLGLGLQL
jgi:tetratricopeptide (TPR) repeat protein